MYKVGLRAERVNIYTQQPLISNIDSQRSVEMKGFTADSEPMPV